MEKRQLNAPDGMWLTQAADVDIAERIVTKQVDLAVNDVADNWREITDEQCNDIIEAQKNLMTISLESI